MVIVVDFGNIFYWLFVAFTVLLGLAVAFAPFAVAIGAFDQWRTKHWRVRQEPADTEEAVIRIAEPYRPAKWEVMVFRGLFGSCSAFVVFVVAAGSAGWL